MDELWKSRFERVLLRRDEEEEHAFVQAVEEVRGRCTRDVASVLLRSFTDRPDFGTQEHVLSTLASAAPSDLIEAILEELPRLVREAIEWAVVLIGQELQFRPALLVRAARFANRESREALCSVLNREDVKAQFSAAGWVASELQ